MSEIFTPSVRINYFEIESKDFQILYDIFQNIIPQINRNNNFSEFIYKNTYFIKNIKKDHIADILEIAEKYFERYGYRNHEIKRNNYFIELSRYKCIKNEKPLQIFGYHKDDKSTTDYKVNTIIFYLEKNDTIVGGDLKVKINNKENCIPIEKRKAICFKGDLLHTPTEVSGEGVRDCIVVQIHRK